MTKIEADAMIERLATRRPEPEHIAAKPPPKHVRRADYDRWLERMAAPRHPVQPINATSEMEQ